MQGRIRLMTALTPACAHALQRVCLGRRGGTGAVDFGQYVFQLRPIRLRPISTSADCDVGQFLCGQLRPLFVRVRPIWAVFDFGKCNFGKFEFGWAHVSGRPEETQKRWNPQSRGPRGWEPTRVGAQKGGGKKVGPRSVRSPTFHAIFPLPPQIPNYFLFLGSSRRTVAAVQGHGPLKCACGLLWNHLVRAPAALKAARVSHLREKEKRSEMWGGRGGKKRTFGLSREGRSREAPRSQHLKAAPTP